MHGVVSEGFLLPRVGVEGEERHPACVAASLLHECCDLLLVEQRTAGVFNHPREVLAFARVA